MDQDQEATGTEWEEAMDQDLDSMVTEWEEVMAL